MDFYNLLTQWYLENKRDLPWRNTRDPYLIWLSEIILQQTKVAQGLPYYLAFTQKYPDVFALANASETEVLHLWQGLGYYSRARNLHAAAKEVVENMNGIFPTQYNLLLKLKGIGPYTAAAIASFSANLPHVVVDGNVFRVLSRCFALFDDIAIAASRNIFHDLALKLLHNRDSDIFNQAIMEFGALQCVPKNPNCEVCPLQYICEAKQKNMVPNLPFKSPKAKPINRYFDYLILLDNQNKVYIEKRVTQDIWKHLYQFKLVSSTEKLLDIIEVEDYLVKNDFAVKNISLVGNAPIKHQLTHQTLFIHLWEVKLNQMLTTAVSLNEVLNFPFPKVLQYYIENQLKK